MTTRTEANREPSDHLGFGTRNLFRSNVPSKPKPNPSLHFPSQSGSWQPSRTWTTLDFRIAATMIRSDQVGFSAIDSDSLGLGAIASLPTCLRSDLRDLCDLL